MIEVKALITFVQHKHKYLGIVVDDGRTEVYARRRMTVDVPVNRDQVLEFLALEFKVNKDEIVWPERIALEDEHSKLRKPHSPFIVPSK